MVIFTNNEERVWLRKIRRYKKITLAQLATVVGVSESSICHYESGKRDSCTNIAVAIASTLNFPPILFFPVLIGLSKE